MMEKIYLIIVRPEGDEDDETRIVSWAEDENAAIREIARLEKLRDEHNLKINEIWERRATALKNLNLGANPPARKTGESWEEWATRPDVISAMKRRDELEAARDAINEKIPTRTGLETEWMDYGDYPDMTFEIEEVERAKS